MVLQLTPELLDFLKARGFRYCLSKTSLCDAENDIVKIALTPTLKRPKTKHLPLGFDTYFSMGKDPAQLSKGVDGTITVVSVDFLTFTLYINKMLGTQTGGPYGSLLLVKNKER